MAGAWQVVCVIKELPHARFARRGDDLIFRCCVTEQELEQEVKVSVPVLGGGKWVSPAECGGASGSSKSKKQAGKTSAGKTSQGAKAGEHAQQGKAEPDDGARQGCMKQVVFTRDEFDLALPESLFGRKICERRIPGEGMPIKGGPHRGDMVVELLVGNRLQVLVVRCGMVAGLARVWSIALHGLLLVRNCFFLLVGHARRSALAQRVGAEWYKGYGRAREVLREVIGPWAPLLQEGAAHVGLFCVLMIFNPLYAYMHAFSIALRLYADGRR